MAYVLSDGFTAKGKGGGWSGVTGQTTSSSRPSSDDLFNVKESQGRTVMTSTHGHATRSGSSIHRSPEIDSRCHVAVKSCGCGVMSCVVRRGPLGTVRHTLIARCFGGAFPGTFVAEGQRKWAITRKCPPGLAVGLAEPLSDHSDESASLGCVRDGHTARSLPDRGAVHVVSFDLGVETRRKRCAVSRGSC